MIRLSDRLQRLVGRADADVEHPCGAGTILLPPGHKLPEYQRLHPRYDRFLPHLARFVPAGTTIVDVGANVGDTVAAMAPAAPQAHFLCVEPDPTFFRYLEVNAARVRAALPRVSITLRQSLVGRQVQRARLEGGGGTAHAQLDAGGLEAVRLDALVAGAALPPLSLLKSDVDGFDFDVLDSAMASIAAQHPMLFFECQPLEPAQLEGFLALLPRLQAAGYRHWAAFDNFGQVLLRDDRASTMAQLVDYAWQQGRRPGTRTVYYVDLLAATDRHAAAMTAALDSY